MKQRSKKKSSRRSDLLLFSRLFLLTVQMPCAGGCAALSVLMIPDREEHARADIQNRKHNAQNPCCLEILGTEESGDLAEIVFPERPPDIRGRDHIDLGQRLTGIFQQNLVQKDLYGE